MKILVVDDSSTMRRIIENTLKRLDYKDIEKAEDGVKAWDLFNEKTFDFVMTDWNMPEMDGLELVKKIRSVNNEIPILMITTEGGKSSVITALKAGVNNYIVKPFTPQILKGKLQEIMPD